LADRYFSEGGTPLSATSTSGLAVVYTAKTAALCQVLDLGNGKFSVQPVYPLTGANTITCVITAAQPGDTRFNAAASVDRSMLISKQPTQVNVRTSASIPTAAGIFLYASTLTTAGRITGSITMVSMASLTPAICTISDIGVFDTTNGPRGTVRAKANGTCQIKIDYPGNSDSFPSTTTWIATVTGITGPPVGSNAPQTITFPAIPNREFGAGVYPKAVASSSLPVTYRSLTPTVCYIITQLAAGPAIQTVYPKPAGDNLTCTVEASQAGDDRFAAAPPVTQSFVWSKAAMYITPYWAPSNVRNVRLQPLTSTSYVSNSTYFFTSSLLFTSGQNSGLLSIGHIMSAVSTTPDICTVQVVEADDRTGGIFTRATVRMINVGTCSITWGFAGTDSRLAATSVMNVVISR
jgi:hypothetical protein